MSHRERTRDCESSGLSNDYVNIAEKGYFSLKAIFARKNWLEIFKGIFLGGTNGELFFNYFTLPLFSIISVVKKPLIIFRVHTQMSFIF